jgi:hypothetical protein
LEVFSENVVKWDQLNQTLNRVGYSGLLSIERDDTWIDRYWDAPEALEMIRKQNFSPSQVAFDAAFSSKQIK